MKHTKLLFILQLGLIDHTTNLEDAIREQLLSTSIAIDNDTLRQITSECKESCLIVLDSFDETEMDILAKKQNNGNIVEVIRYKHLRGCRVLITTRPWREGEIINQYGSKYKRLQLKPLSKSDVLDLVGNYFNRSKDDLAAPGLSKLGKRLSQCIQRNEIVIDLSTPMLVILVCSLFEGSRGRKIPNRLGELYHSVLSMLGKSKLSSPASVEDLIDKLGEVAVKGLTPGYTNLVFGETDFPGSVFSVASEIGVLTEKHQTGKWQFFHKSVQEFCAGYFLSNVEKS
ncbi:NLR family CARD domain-containing protein 4-like [Amphiura filiformis]|uniref:NLR family CARD domain-containing protein 4-like n=1 Tax=Amphiura filiformis TaxID=82378 RepID=UPI003B2109BB